MSASAEDHEIKKLAYAEVSRAHQAITDFRAKLLALQLGSARRWKHELIARLSAKQLTVMDGQGSRTA